jgi:hypothetical protein
MGRGRGCAVCATTARATTDGGALVPAALRADGSMVPDGSMMPFPMPPFDMVGAGCTCTEYIPRRRESAGRTSEGALVAMELRWGPMGVGRRRRGGDSRRVCVAVGAFGVVAKGRCGGREGARCKFPKFQRGQGDGAASRRSAVGRNDTIHSNARQRPLECVRRPGAGQDTAAGRQIGCASR